MLRVALLFIMLPALLPVSCFAWSARVISVADGDTVTVMHNERIEKICLYGVDAPDMGQDYGPQAMEFLSRMSLGKNAEVEAITTDPFGRTVAIVMIEKEVLNREVVRNGYGWVKPSCKMLECSEWLKLQQQAKSSRLGLWSLRSPLPPWEFHHGRKDAIPAGATAR